MFSLSVASSTSKISVCQTESSESDVSQKLSQEWGHIDSVAAVAAPS